MSPAPGQVDEPLALRRLRLWVEWRDAHHGIAPTGREFGAACGLASTSHASYTLHRLVNLGWIGELASDDYTYLARAQYLTDKGEAALAQVVAA